MGEKAYNPETHSDVTHAGRGVFVRTSGCTWEEALDSSGKVREGLKERRHSGASLQHPFLWELLCFPPCRRFPGPRHCAPPLSAAGTNQSEPLSPGHSDWLREGPKLSPESFPWGSSAREENCLLTLNSGCWMVVKVRTISCHLPLLPSKCKYST